MTATVIARPTIKSKEVKLKKDGSTITVRATNAERPRRLEHTLERCSLAYKSHEIRSISKDGVLNVTVTVRYDDVRLTGDIREDAKSRSDLNEAMDRIVESLLS